MYYFFVNFFLRFLPGAFLPVQLHKGHEPLPAKWAGPEGHLVPFSQACFVLNNIYLK